MDRGAVIRLDNGRKLQFRGSVTGDEVILRENLLDLKESVETFEESKVVNSTLTEIALETRSVNPRAFDPWPADRPLPCFPPDGLMIENGPIAVRHNRPVKKGFFFLKTYKTGSSTSAGVNLRIARNTARRQRRDFDFCRARFDHGHPWKFYGSTLFGNRTIGESFLWAVLRDPTKRAISQFFHFKVSRAGWAPTDANFFRTLRVDKKNNYVRTLSLRPFHDDEHDGFDFANQIVKDYDFIGVTERIDEVRSIMFLRWLSFSESNTSNFSLLLHWRCF